MEIDAVSQLIRNVAAEVVLPRWQSLEPHQISQKERGDMVTAADHEAEALLEDGLRALMPGAEVLGEEAAAANPAVLEHLHTAEHLWIIDPVDGTNNFIKGRETFAVMVALLTAGQAVASWIYLPVRDCMAVAEYGSGAQLDGRHLRPADRPVKSVGDMVAAAHITRFPDDIRPRLKSNAARFKANRPAFCAGWDYLALAEGRRDLLLYYRTLAWDHAPGSLLIGEAGGYCRTLDGGLYDPAQNARGLMSATCADTWRQGYAALFGG
ncbi:MAG: inositol monophosphatase family protein [Sphingomonadales bacterium]